MVRQVGEIRGEMHISRDFDGTLSDFSRLSPPDLFRETTPLVRAGTRPGLSQGREGPGPAPGSQLGLERSLSLGLVRDVLGSELGPGQGRGLILGQGRGRGWGLGEGRDVISQVW